MINSIPIYYKYISKEFLLSFFVCFVFFFFIFFANQILFLAEQILSKRIPLIEVVLLLVFFMPNMVSLAFPFATLVSSLMAVSRLCSDNEILAMQSSGISYKQIFLPILIIGGLLTASSFIINDYFLPAGTIGYNKLLRRLIHANPALEIESFSVNRYIDTILITGEVKGKTIDDIIIIDRTPEGNKRFIVAENVVLEDARDDESIISFSLSNVFSHFADQKREFDYSYFKADKMIYNILLSDITIALRSPGPREMSSYDVFRSIREKERRLHEDHSRTILANDINYMDFTGHFIELSSVNISPGRKNIINNEMQRFFRNYVQLAEPPSDRLLQTFRLEFHRKFSLPAACLLFVFLAYPIGLFSTRRSGKSIGFGVGLIISLLYWCIMFAGTTLGIRTNTSPIIAMWLPNIVIAISATILFLVRFLR
ncbi:MAG: LptF/LptG family permease [Spirochaetes bacterium]|nr:LptF/LptG family permease [Spirochaetota bacterium]